MKSVLMVSVLLLFVLVGLSSGAIFVVHGASEASSAVNDAGNAVGVAFNATLQAERDGANVSDLIARLNEAVGLLDDAEVALNSENLSEASSMAGQCIGIAENVKSEADGLKASALNEAESALWMPLTFSVVGIALFLLLLLLVWQRFKREYARKVLDTKPEVASNEA